MTKYFNNRPSSALHTGIETVSGIANKSKSFAMAATRSVPTVGISDVKAAAKTIDKVPVAKPAEPAVQATSQVQSSNFMQDVISNSIYAGLRAERKQERAAKAKTAAAQKPRSAEDITKDRVSKLAENGLDVKDESPSLIANIERQ